MRALAAIAILCIMGTLAFNWSHTPVSSAPCGQHNNCATCHQGSAPRTHTAEFVEAGHGPAAFLDRQQCLGCHQQQDSCDDCHLKTPPAWHSEDFCRPALGARVNETNTR